MCRNHLLPTLGLSLALMLLLGNVRVAQAQDLLDPENIGIQELKDIFKEAYIDVLQETDTWIKVKDGNICFVDIDKSHRYLKYNLGISLDDAITKEQALSYCNKVNSELILVTTYYEESNHRIQFYYYLWIEGGTTKASIIKAQRIYQKILTAAFAKDEEDIL